MKRDAWIDICSPPPAHRRRRRRHFRSRQRLAAFPPHEVTLFEAADYLGGHTNTVDVTLEGMTHPVDTGFLVFNDRTYPNLIALFAHLGVASVETEMSFAVSLENPDLEWAGSSLATVFGQKRNLLRPQFWRMLADILRFNRESAAWLAAHPDDGRSLRDFLAAGRYSATFCRLVSAADGGGDLVLPDRPDARLSARHLRALLPQSRPAAGLRPAAVAHGQGWRPRVRAASWPRRSTTSASPARCRRVQRDGSRPARRTRPRRRALRPGRAGLPQRSGAGDSRRDGQRRAARGCSAPSATSPTAPCCIPTARCCRATSAVVGMELLCRQR